MGLLFLLLAFIFGGFGLASADEVDAPRRSYSYTVPSNELGRPPELWPKRSTHNAPDG